MKINLTAEPRKTIGVGDVVICEESSYLIVKISDSSWPIVAIDLANGQKVNGFERTSAIGTHIYSRSGKILEVVKSNELEIRRVQK